MVDPNDDDAHEDDANEEDASRCFFDEKFFVSAHKHTTNYLSGFSFCFLVLSRVADVLLFLPHADDATTASFDDESTSAFNWARVEGSIASRSISTSSSSASLTRYG